MIQTNCGYVVEADITCSGSHYIDKRICHSCPIFENTTFYGKYPTQTTQKRVVVKVHAFGVTVTPK